MALARGTVFARKWQIGDVIGEGACARVYSVKGLSDTVTNKWVAKIIPTPKGSGKVAKEQQRLIGTLFHERTLIVGHLMQFPFRPEVPDITNFSGVDEELGIRYMILERLDYDLTSFMKANVLSISQVAEIGLQILEGMFRSKNCSYNNNMIRIVITMLSSYRIFFNISI